MTGQLVTLSSHAFRGPWFGRYLTFTPSGCSEPFLRRCWYSSLSHLVNPHLLDWTTWGGREEMKEGVNVRGNVGRGVLVGGYDSNGGRKDGGGEGSW